MLNNPGREYDQQNRIQDNGPNYKEDRPPSEFFELSKLGVAIQATYVGAPMVYYGDEVGAWGADDPTDRKPIPWPDVVEAAGGMKNAGEVFDEELRAYYRSWLRLRQNDVVGPILRFGTVRHVDAGRDDVFCFVRELNGRQVWVVVNRGAEEFDAASIVPGLRPGTRTGDAQGVGVVGGVSAAWWVRGAE
jgi:glycosidase